MSSAKSILKSSSIIAASQLIGIIFNLIRSKVVAVLLGPQGTGLIGALQSSISLVQSFAAIGLDSSAVREVAKSKSEEDDEGLYKTVYTLRKAVLITGIFGLICTVLLAGFLSKTTFGSDSYTWEIRFLAVAVFFNIIKGGQSALLQGMRRIKDLAKMSIWASALSTVIAIPILYFLKMDGIALFIVLLAIGQYLVSLYYASKIRIPKLNLSINEVWQNSKSMAKLGISFMGGALAGLLGTFLIKIFIIRSINLEAAGIYQAAVAISGLFIGVVLQAMGKDFYPRLTAVAGNRIDEIKIINEQTEIGMMLSAPGLLLTLAFAPFAIDILYTHEYAQAFSILQWMILGVYVRTASWPIGYLFIARGYAKLFFIVQVVSNIVHLALIYFLVKYYSLLGTGIAFFGMYLIHLIYMFFIARYVNSFKWSTEVKKYLFVFSLLFGSSLLILQNVNQWVGSTVVSLLSVLAGFFAVRRISEIMEVKSFRKLLIKLVKKKK